MSVTEKERPSIGNYAPDFELPGVDGEVHHLARYLEARNGIGVVFVSNHCPMVQSYLERLRILQERFADRGFTLIGINSNDATEAADENLDGMKQFAQTHQLNFPYLRDVTQDVAQGFGAEKTPEVFLVDRSGVVCYRGAIDDRPEDPTAVQSAYLVEAIAEMLAGSPISNPVTVAVGTPIRWR